MQNGTKGFVITIDGAAGTGKSSVARELAHRLGTDCLDTGAMYRAVAVLAIDFGLDPRGGEALALAIREKGIRFDWNDDPPTILLGGEDIARRVRDLDVSGVVSIVAQQPEIREVLVEQQRAIRELHPLLVTEGRDQGSVVFPDANVRFFLEAEVAERTRRRVKQLRDAGNTVQDKEIQLDIESRDKLDSSRADGPLICPDGAIIINTSSLSKEEVVSTMESEVHSRLQA
ncbi:MAG: (d)CMP kinase [Phycisphaerae bacterium]|jgi:CMP/dCMP kinase|nr:(d)CMP kinase [Phycisphaerae bacterium]MBT5409302.1 (d)CMP kinase [Phycisphaerae bacterium]MBT6165461.1 (d)CMP kinase [Phycisphaerae bacterium]MBT7658439.1 (d)CMP kinase [Phycisphaerae bacterium]